MIRVFKRHIIKNGAIALLFLPTLVLADGYPEKNINYLITFNPGGGSDIRARQQQFNTNQVVVDH